MTCLSSFLRRSVRHHGVMGLLYATHVNRSVPNRFAALFVIEMPTNVEKAIPELI